MVIEVIGTKKAVKFYSDVFGLKMYGAEKARPGASLANINSWPFSR